MIVGVFTKFGALFVTIPDPIIGGVFMVMFGMLLVIHCTFVKTYQHEKYYYANLIKYKVSFNAEIGLLKVIFHDISL